MLHRIKRAFQKLRFCYQISGDINSFSRLVINTKRQNKTRSTLEIIDEHPLHYKLKLNRESREVYLRTAAGDISILYEIFLDKTYDFATVPNVECILDLGANIGMTSLFFLQKFPMAKIYSIEPDIENFRILSQNLASGIATKKLNAFNIAIHKQPGLLYLKKSRFAYNSSTSLEEEDGTQVEGVDLNNFCRNNQIQKVDLLKVDIEGAEEIIFSENLEWLNLIRSVVIEFHSPQSKVICESALRNNGFQLHPEELPPGNKNFIWAHR